MSQARRSEYPRYFSFFSVVVAVLCTPYSAPRTTCMPTVHCTNLRYEVQHTQTLTEADRAALRPSILTSATWMQVVISVAVQVRMRHCLRLPKPPYEVPSLCGRAPGTVQARVGCDWPARQGAEDDTTQC
ncbi:hypothetical protein J3F83DRAFT_723514 [Trichoderma novae-zelandiae]